MIVEVCAYSLESCLNAQAGGGGRIELCGGLGEGGTTPSAGLIAQVKKNVALPVYVMIRPRGGDFVYDARELELMELEIDLARSLGADGLVFGVLEPDGSVAVETTRRLVERAGPLGVTFHRAFDLTPDPFRALEDVIATGAERILTSGQQANVTLGSGLLKALSAKAAGRIEIMAGGGVSKENVGLLLDAGVHSIHLTAKAFRRGKQLFFPPGVSMAGEQPDERSIMYSDPSILKEVVRLANMQ